MPRKPKRANIGWYGAHDGDEPDLHRSATEWTVITAEHLMRQGQLRVSEETLMKLGKVSVPTLKQILPRIK